MKEEHRQKKAVRRPEHWQVVSAMLMVYDFIAVCAAYFLALWLRFDGVYKAIPLKHIKPYSTFILPWAAVSVLIFLILRMYRGMWRLAGYSEFIRTFMGSLISSVLHAILITVLLRRMPISYYLLGAVFQGILLIGIRFSFRFADNLRYYGKRMGNDATRVMLIGAGNAGQSILKDVNRSREVNSRIVCVIDDNPNKWNRYLEGIPIVGGRDDILAAAEKYRVDEIYLAIPSATAQQKRDILNVCSETGCKLKQLPGIYQLVTGEVAVSAMKEVSIEDLLGRAPVKTDLDEVFSFIHGKAVLVTGGGGSIGSELCRQIAGHGPRQLIIFDIYENNAYSIQLELKDQFPDLHIETLIGSVRDSRRMFEVFRTYRPEIVYHAAAHKHVPLMEDSPCEAIKNNAVGTYKTAYAAMVNGCRRFVLISTDKAVYPINVMGASKRICEMIIQAFDKKIKAGKAGEIPQLFTHNGMENADKAGDGKVFRDIRTEFVAVRFGNVLGSNGSVIPVFKRQIEQGGPVTVTHPDIIRYFMTIQEAVSLVMLAGTYAKGGEIFVLDMGSPVKIDTLARNLIKLSGFKPDVDIEIRYTGLRPGEKLYEEKLMEEEGMQTTANEKIFIGRPMNFDENEFLASLSPLMRAAYDNKPDIRDWIRQIVDTYHPEKTGSKDGQFRTLAEGSK